MRVRFSPGGLEWRCRRRFVPVSQPQPAREQGWRHLLFDLVCARAQEYRHIVCSNVAYSHFLSDPIREPVLLRLRGFEFPDGCDIAVDLTVGSGLRWFHVGVDPSRNQMLDADKVRM